MEYFVASKNDDDKENVNDIKQKHGLKLVYDNYIFIYF